ncbi:MAG TPA: hypothetical protein VNG71_08315 [Pyrinomonadaceae bacterium]|nr:hypothetical protein [Pyrinomonadaceae bacterium]
MKMKPTRALKVFWRHMNKLPIAIALIIIFVTACGFLPRKVKVGEEFTLHSGEKISVSGADLTIEVKSIGHQWYVDRRAESGYAELIIKGRGASGPRKVGVGETVDERDYVIKVNSINPFGAKPDCALIVNQK